MKKPHGDSGTTRRALLTRAVGVSAAAALGGSLLSAAPASAWSGPTQPGWRFCNNCFAMFLPGAPGNVCPAGGQHFALGWTFQLPYNYSTTGGGETAHDQANWRRCFLCGVLYWTGTTSWTAGVCPTGWQHDFISTPGATYMQYVLPHDIGEPPWTQDEWMYCINCSELFYNGNGSKGRCPRFVGVGHNARGFVFAIPVYSYT